MPYIGPEFSLYCTFFIFGFAIITHLMYKERTERTEKAKYGLAWVIVPFLSLLFTVNYPFLYDFYLDPGDVYLAFILLVIPAIVIDVIYIYKTR